MSEKEQKAKEDLWDLVKDLTEIQQLEVLELLIKFNKQNLLNK